MTRILYFIIICLTVLQSGCTKNDQAATSFKQISLLQYIGQDTTLSLLHTAIVHAKVDTFFNNGGPYTIFAPDNIAFRKMGLTKVQIEAFDPVELSKIITYHIIPGKISSAALVGFSSAFPTSLNPAFSPSVKKTYNGMFFDGVHIDKGNIDVADGVVHLIQDISFPPVDLMMQTLEKQPELSFFTAGLKRCKTLLGFLATDTLTLLACTDQAFRDFGIRDIDQINQMDTFALSKLLSPFVLRLPDGRLYSPDFIGGKVLSSYPLNFPLLPAPNNRITQFQFRISADGKQIVPNKPDQPTGILVPPDFLRTNILTRRGIIHIVDQLFVP